MRVFGVGKDGAFTEYRKTPFQADHDEAVLEAWLENNPDGIVEDDSLLMIGRQVTTNLGSIIDLLAIDRQGDVVVLELKRGKTPRETLAQALEYASFVEPLDWAQLEDIFGAYINDESVHLAEYHRQYFALGDDEAVSFNKDQRIVIVGQAISDEIRQTATFLQRKGLRVTCVEFSFFQAEDGARLLSNDLVVGRQPSRVTRVSSGSLPVVTQEQFLASLDENGRPVFDRLLGLAAAHAYPIHWGTKGFSMNVDLDGTHVAVCYGYPPHAVFKQSIYTALVGQGGLVSKIRAPEELVQSVRSEAEATGLFQPAGREIKCVIDRALSEDELEALLGWVEKVAVTVEECGLRE